MKNETQGMRRLTNILSVEKQAPEETFIKSIYFDYKEVDGTMQIYSHGDRRDSLPSIKKNVDLHTDKPVINAMFTQLAKDVETLDLSKTGLNETNVSLNTQTQEFYEQFIKDSKVLKPKIHLDDETVRTEPQEYKLKLLGLTRPAYG